VTLSLGIFAPYAYGVITSGPLLAEFVGIAEECGVESIWTVEHVVEADVYEKLYPYSDSGEMPVPLDAAAPYGGRLIMADPLELLAFMAAASTTVKLGTSVVVAPLHSAAILAKRAATLACLSGGRLELGLGIGWQKEEYRAVGVPFSDRGPRLEETVAAMRALWAAQPASYHGRFVDFDRVHSLPPPPDGTVPIVLGGNSDAAVRRCARIGDGWYPHAMGPDEFARGVSLLRATAADSGRDPASVRISVAPVSADHTKGLDRDWARRYVDHGATRLIIGSSITGPHDVAKARDDILRYREQVFDPLDDAYR
jgi:probable F420-dependent oxidoreductase